MRRPLVAALLAVCAAAAAAGQTIPAADTHVARMGRTVAEADGTVRFGYPGVTLSLVVDGTRLAVDAAGTASSLVDVIVDGKPAGTLHLAPQVQSYDVFKGAAPGSHRVELVHRSETWLGVVSIARFTADGRFLAAPTLPRRRLLVLGDSVTCGADMERGAGDKDTPGWWNPRLSYGMLAARALDAQVQLVCYGGRGLVRSWNDRTDEFQLPAFYDLAIADAAHPVRWNQADYAPDLIVIAIGTNDFNPGIPERAAYVDTYAALLRRVLRDHPHAQIALTEGVLLNGDKKAALIGYLKEAMGRVGDRRVHLLAPVAYQPGDAVNGHPTTAQHAAMAAEILPQLRRIAGW
ncbi:bifunctional acetylxylan esterase/glucomannan deacetylase AxeC2 [Massilia sp. CT11-137]|uniref:bifunctional acetylxylan esterase/glucomannan deacetylase AxeC2 n=1 Tax=Massilia sp. CT11-137 TaxID=3393901 RepID=UPI0039B08E56